MKEISDRLILYVVSSVCDYKPSFSVCVAGACALVCSVQFDPQQYLLNTSGNGLRCWVSDPEDAEELILALKR